MKTNDDFWKHINTLVQKNEIIIDRPKGSRHPKYTDIIYEFDYGYLKNTKTTDGSGIDVFKGTLHNKTVTSIICTVDLLKKDIEIKLLIGCTIPQKRKIYEFLNESENMKAILIEKDILTDNSKKEIVPIKDEYNFAEIYKIFEDVIGKPTEENVRNILLEYQKDGEKTLYGYYLDKKIVGIIGIRNILNKIEILHFGIHPEYRGKNLGTELMDYIKDKKKPMELTTDDDAIFFIKTMDILIQNIMMKNIIVKDTTVSIINKFNWL
jgi:inorganic pyrophosphatase